MKSVARPLVAVAAVIAAGFGGSSVLGGQPLGNALNLPSAIRAVTGSPTAATSVSDGAPAPVITPNPSRSASAAAASASASAATAAPAVTPVPAPAPKPTTPSLGQLSLADRQAWASQDYSVHSGPNKTKAVMLTYDDCPNSWDKFETTVLGAEKLGISLVMFPTGQCLDAGYFDTKFARAHGMYVFNHSVSHPHLGDLSTSAALQEIGGAGVVASWGRPPFGDISSHIRALYEEKGMRIWLWDIDTQDWNGHKSQSTVVNYVLSNSYEGATVLMHMQESAFNPTALAQIKAGLAKDGLSICRNQGPVEQFPRTLNC